MPGSTNTGPSLTPLRSISNMGRATPPRLSTHLWKVRTGKLQRLSSPSTRAAACTITFLRNQPSARTGSSRSTSFRPMSVLRSRVRYAISYTGYRIPFTVISPYAKKNYVSHTVMDETAILKFIEERFNLPPLTSGMLPSRISPSSSTSTIRSGCLPRASDAKHK